MLTSFGNFKLEGELKKVVIKDGVTNVSNYALFFLPAATQITLPESVTSIGRYGIALCSKLNGVSLPKAVTAIGDFGLAGNSFTAVSLVPSACARRDALCSDRLTAFSSSNGRFR